MYEEILAQMQELSKDEIKNFNGDFGKLEQMVTLGRWDSRKIPFLRKYY